MPKTKSKAKNPFVHCKSRKKRKPRVVTAIPVKGFCPKTMVRYDDSPNEYKTSWVCKMCFKFLLSEEAVRNHLKVCNSKSFYKPLPPPKSVEDMRYICEHCNRIFTRKVTLHRHIAEHHKLPSDSEEDVMFDDDDKMLFEENENMAEENEIMAEENEIMVEENKNMAEENEIMVEENKNMAEENEIRVDVIEMVPIMNDQIENNMPTMVYENKIEPLVVVDENKTVVEESKKLVDESRVLVDDVKIFIDENKTLVPEEIESVKEINVDGEKQNVCENLLV